MQFRLHREQEIVKLCVVTHSRQAIYYGNLPSCFCHCNAFSKHVSVERFIMLIRTIIVHFHQGNYHAFSKHTSVGRFGMYLNYGMVYMRKIMQFCRGQFTIRNVE